MLNKIKKIGFAITLLLLPAFSFAQQLGKTKTLLESARDIVTRILIPLAFVLALLFFFWGVAKYVWAAGDGKDEGKKIMIWGVIALFVMASIWGIVSFIGKNLGLDEIPEMTAPTIKL